MAGHTFSLLSLHEATFQTNNLSNSFEAHFVIQVAFIMTGIARKWFIAGQIWALTSNQTVL